MEWSSFTFIDNWATSLNVTQPIKLIKCSLTNMLDCFLRRESTENDKKNQQPLHASLQLPLCLPSHISFSETHIPFSMKVKNPDEGMKCELLRTILDEGFFGGGFRRCEDF